MSKYNDFICKFCGRTTPGSEFDLMGTEIYESARLNLPARPSTWEKICCDGLRGALKKQYRDTAWETFKGMVDRAMQDDYLPEPLERRALEILLSHLPEGFWNTLRGHMRENNLDEFHMNGGMAIRNCLRLHGFVDKDVPTGNLDDIWEHLASIACAAAEKKDWVAARKAWPARKMRNDIQGAPRATGDKLWSSCYTLASELCSRILTELKGPGRPSHWNEAQLRKEALILTMWIITQELPYGKDPLEVMHDGFFSYAGISAEENPDNAATLKEINERYNYFFKAKEGGSGPLLVCLLGQIMTASNSCLVSPGDSEIIRDHYLKTSERLKSISKQANPN